MSEIFEVLTPEGPAGPSRSLRSEPLADLAGKTVGQLWDYAFRGDFVFSLIRRGLSARYPDIKFVDYSVFGNTHGAHEAEVVAALPALLRQHGVDAVISGVGA